MAIERNAKLRAAYFKAHPTAICDACQMDAAKRFPWAKAMLEIHHLLPLSSGTRVEQSGTVFSDLAPLCPTCHRGVHRYYEEWLRSRGRVDFTGVDESRRVYQAARRQIRKLRDA